jgi:peptidyl-prolyl cis-trans isomerase C
MNNPPVSRSLIVRLITSRLIVPPNRAAIVGIWAALFALTGSSYGQVQDPVVARVDGTDIHQSDLRLAEEDLAKSLPPQQDEGAKREFLIAYLTDVFLMSKTAKSQNVGNDPELQRRMEFTLNKALMEKLLQVTAQSAVTKEAVRKAYDDAVRTVQPEPELRMRSILFRFPNPDDEAAVSAAESRAKTALSMIAEGEDFASVAGKMTDNTSAKLNGGDLGYLTRAQMGKEYADVAFQLAKGGVSAPIKTQFGWHIIKVEDERIRQVLEFDAVRNTFEAIVARKAQLDLVAKLRSEAKIERLDKPEVPENRPAGQN